MRFRWFRFLPSLVPAWLTPGRRIQVGRAAVIVLLAVLAFRGLRQGGALDGNRSNDSAAFIAAARGALAGDLGPSYDAPRPYQYPPTLAVLIAPLGLLPDRAAAAAWTLGSLALFFLAIRMVPAAVGTADRFDVFAGLLLVFRAAESDFGNGNSNTIVLAILVLGLAAARRGRPGLGGAILGVAAAVKVTPLFLLPWLLAGRRWRMALGFAAGLGLAGIVFPAIVLGPGPYAEALRAFHGITLRPLDASGEGYRDEPPGGYFAGQSLRSLLHRLLRATDATAHDQETIRVNVADLPKGAVDGIYVVIGAAATLALLWRFRRPGNGPSGVEAGAVLAAMVLLSPLSRKAHFVVLFPAAVAGFAAIRAAGGRRRWILAGLWAAAFALADLTAPAVLGRALATRVLAYCPLGIAGAALVLLCALMGGGGGPTRASPRSSAPPGRPSP